MEELPIVNSQPHVAYQKLTLEVFRKSVLVRLKLLILRFEKTGATQKSDHSLTL